MRTTPSYYNRERRRGRLFSALLHVLFLVIAITGLPSFLSPPPPEEPVVISVELLPITGITNVKPSDSKPADEVKPEEKHSEQKKPSPPVKTAEATPPPPPDTAVEEKKEKEREKAEALKKAREEKKKKEKEKKKKEQDELNAILKAVKTTAQKEKEKEKKKEEAKTDTSPSKSTSTNYNPNMPMSLSEKDAIMSQIARCWTVPAGAKDAQNLVIVLNAEYNQDGSYIHVEMNRDTASKAASDSFYRAAADSAIRAVKECSPLRDLPPQKYDTWRQMELRFDPRYMLN